MAAPSPESNDPPATKTSRRLNLLSVQAPIPSDFIHGTFKGEPSITIPKETVASLAARFENTLIGKFSRGKPHMELIRKFLSVQNFAGAVLEGLLDKKHVVLRFELFEDYVRLFSKPIWNVYGKSMRILKWTPDFDIDREPSIVPIWICLPRLPIHLVNQDFIFSLVSSFSKPLRIDNATENLKRPSVARVQVEFDLLETLPSRVWIQNESGRGFWQSIFVEDHLPPYCRFCWHIGHEEHSCTVKYPEIQQPFIQRQGTYTQREFRPKQKTVESMECTPHQKENDTNAFDYEIVDNVFDAVHKQVQTDEIVEKLGSKDIDSNDATPEDIASSQMQQLDVVAAELGQVQLQISVVNDTQSFDAVASLPQQTMAAANTKLLEDTLEMHSRAASPNPEMMQATPTFSQYQEKIVNERKMEARGKEKDQNVEADDAVLKVTSSLISGGVTTKGKMDEVIAYPESCPISNSFEVLSIPLTKEKSSGIDKLSIQDELRHMSLDPKAQWGAYISDKVFEEKFTPAKKPTRTRKPKQILDL